MKEVIKSIEKNEIISILEKLRQEIINLKSNFKTYHYNRAIEDVVKLIDKWFKDMI